MQRIFSRFAFVFLLLLTVSACQKDDPDNGDDGDDVNYHSQGLGAAANDLLSDGTYTSLEVQIGAVSGFELTSGTLQNFEAFLETYLNKPNGITIEQITVPADGSGPFSLEEVQAMEEAHRTAFNNGDRLAVWLWVANGDYADNSNVLGIAYRNTSMCLFEDRIRYVSGGLGEPSREVLETTVLHHEMGHLLGLVDVGSPMVQDHRDDANGRHCDVDDCLMYYTAETGDIFSNLAGITESPGLDPQCIADLRANGGK